MPLGLRGTRWTALNCPRLGGEDESTISLGGYSFGNTVVDGDGLPCSDMLRLQRESSHRNQISPLVGMEGVEPSTVSRFCLFSILQDKKFALWQVVVLCGLRLT